MATSKPKGSTTTPPRAVSKTGRTRRKPALPTAVAPALTSHSDTAPVTGSRAPVTDRVPANVPLVYADQVIDVVYGVHTSKVVFGVEDGAGGLRPVGVAVIPTASLLIVAANIVRDLTAPGIVEETAQRLGGVVTMMRELTSPPAATLSKPQNKSTEKG